MTVTTKSTQEPSSVVNPGSAGAGIDQNVKRARAQPSPVWDELSARDFDESSQRKGINKFILDLINAFGAQNQACEVRTLEGRTDVTLAVVKFHNNTNKKFILKLSIDDNPQNAKINGKILQLLGLEVPKFFIGKKQDTSFSALWKYAEAQNLNRGTVPKNRAVLVFMEAFPGANLRQFIRTGDIFKLNREQWTRTLEYFGRLAVFDLAIGNHDRFFRVQTGISIEDTEPFCNAGNILLHSPRNAPADKVPVIYTIDNGSYYSLLSEAQEMTKQPSGTPECPYFRECQRVFSSLQTNETDRQNFARKIYNGIFNEVLELKFRPTGSKPGNPQQLFPSETFALRPLLSGIDLGFKALLDFAQRQECQTSLTDFIESLGLTDNQKKLMEQMNALFYSCLGINKSTGVSHELKTSMH